jgi:hypothetical protein
MQLAVRISGHVIFIAGFSTCVLLAVVLGVVALCKRKGGEAQRAENTASPGSFLGSFAGHVAEFALGS